MLKPLERMTDKELRVYHAIQELEIEHPWMPIADDLVKNKHRFGFTYETQPLLDSLVQKKRLMKIEEDGLVKYTAVEIDRHAI